MSDDVFIPSGDYPGMTWDIKKTPMFNTKVQTSVNFTELRASFTGSPVYEMSMTFAFLRGNDRYDSADTQTFPVAEVSSLLGFFASRLGRWDSWLIQDKPNDYLILPTATEIFGVGNNVTTVFNLQRTIGDWFSERVANPADTVRIWVDGVEKFRPTHWTGGDIGTKGVITFVTPPGNGLLLTWSGEYYFRARFSEDIMEFNQFMYQLWETQEIKFLASLGTKI